MVDTRQDSDIVVAMTYKKPLLPSKFFPAFKERIPDLSGKTFVITGTTSGTGRVASRTIAEKEVES